MLWAMVPIKSRALAKQRLGELLDAGQRRSLAEAMACDLLDALCCVESLNGRIAIVGSDDFARELARRFGVRLLDEPGNLGLNGALEISRRSLLAEGVDELMVIHGDLPLARADVITKLLHAHGQVTPPAVSLVSDRAGQGTNCLVMSPADALPMVFGEQSLRRFQAEASRCKMHCALIELPELQLDLDEPRDLMDFVAWLEHHADAANGNCARWLRSAGLKKSLADSR